MDTRALTQVPPQIAELARAIREAADDDDGAFIDTLDGEGDYISAARKALRFIREREALADAIDDVIRQYQARKAAFTAGASRTRDALGHFMSEIGERSLQLPEGTVTLAAGRPSLVGDSDPFLLPDDLVRVVRSPDRGAIKDALNAGRDVPGYSLSNGKPSLRILGGKAASE
jgi:hypothetical protein